MKRVLTPSLFITYPPSPFLKKGLFLYFLPFLTLDKIKVGGDSCFTATLLHLIKIKVSSPSYRTGDSAGDTFKEGFTLGLRSLICLFDCFNSQCCLGFVEDESCTRIRVHFKIGAA